MHTISLVIDSALKICSVLNPVPPLSASDVVGKIAWDFSPPDQAEIIQERLSECLAHGVPQSYRVRSDIQPDRIGSLFLVRAERICCEDTNLIHCIATEVPAAVEHLTDAEESFLRLLARHEQKEIARQLGISVQSVSKRERLLREKLRVESRYELRLIAQELEEEHD